MNNNMSYQIRYTTVHIFYQVICLFTYSYASVFMVYHGFTDGAIGIIIAIANAIAAFLQPLLGDFLDRNRKVSVQLVMSGLLLLCIGASVVLLLRSTQLTKATMMVIIISLAMTIQPLINSLCFLLEAKGVFVDFGVSRGIGSGAYALLSTLLGAVLTKVDTGLMPLFYIVAFVGFGGFYLLAGSGAGKLSRQEAGEQLEEEPSREATGLMEFLSRYQHYMLFLAGMVLLFLLQSVACNYYVYQLVVALGGTTKEMGYAVAIAAASEIPVMMAAQRLCRRFSTARVIRFTMVLFIIKHLTIVLATNLPMYYVAQLLQSFSYGLFLPAAVIYAKEVLPTADLIKGQTLFTAGITVAHILASAVGGALIESFSVRIALRPLFCTSLIGAFVIWKSVKKSICKS